MIEQSGMAYTLKCPNSDCKYKIEKSKVQEIVAPDSFKKFQKVSKGLKKFQKV